MEITHILKQLDFDFLIHNHVSFTHFVLLIPLDDFLSRTTPALDTFAPRYIIR